MANFKTPGVYIQEIPTLGSSIAGVPTAIPGFVGYTEKAIIDGVQWTYPLAKPAPPVRITSLLEYQQIFGGPFHEKFTISLTGTVPTPTTMAVHPTSSLSNYILFYQVQMFYANGGGTCYIVSSGDYSTSISASNLTDGIGLLEQVDEITLLATPEAVFLNNTNIAVVNDQMLIQCAKLQNRFAIMDVLHNPSNTIFLDASSFRNSNVGANNLKYGASYYPALDTPIQYFYKDTEVVISDTRTGGTYNYNGIYNNSLSTVNNGVASFAEFTVTGTTFVNTDGVSINGVLLHANVDFATSATQAITALHLKDAINAHPLLSPIVTAFIDSVNTDMVVVQSKIMGSPAGDYPASTLNGTVITFTTTNPGALGGGKNNSADKALYNSIVAELAKYTLVLYPCATMAGIYASVDSDRGVWKAPANVGLALVNEPSVKITDDDQQDLNVDPTSGKSINAIRQFNGRGNLVWGARTLAGNDNEWRYVNVRRLFIYVEESCRKATEFVVFEPNTANTWNRVKGMIEVFLTNLWRDGGLAGATTKDAFFVNVGLGTTMTADDILNGKMIVVIGMAAARPAEFIILQFEHKLQQS